MGKKVGFKSPAKPQKNVMETVKNTINITSGIPPCVFGSDIELMIYGSDGNCWSALRFLDGRKENPTPAEGGAMQADNVNAELNTIPANSFAEFADSWKKIVRSTEEFINTRAAKSKLGNMVLLAKQSHVFSSREVSDPEARIFGCEPDYDAYDVRVNTVDRSMAENGLRTAGGHIHIGVGGSEHEDVLYDMYGRIRVVQAMDLFVAVPFVFIEKGSDGLRRKQLYGGASAHRPKEYGVEYRTMSNFWTADPLLASLVYSLTQDALVAVIKDNPKTKERFSLVDDIGVDAIRSAINLSRTAYASEILKRVRPYFSDTSNILLENALANPVKNTVVAKNWAV